MRVKLLYTCLIILFSVAETYTQQRLIGKVLSADQKIPVPVASVFLSNTSVGTITAEDGSFTINPFPNGRYNLVVSMLGYETYTVEISSSQIPPILTIYLHPKVKELEEVIVEPYEKNGWQKWGNFFLETLIGKTPNSLECIFHNKESIRFRFNKKENTLKAFASEPLRITNNALGYELRYDLTNFEYNFKQGLFFYQGYPFFTEIATGRQKKKTKWERNRIDAYEGSLMHFFRSLFRNKIIEDGFELRRIIRKKEKNLRISINGNNPLNDMDILINTPITGDSIAFAIDSATAGLQFTDYLQVVYPKKMPFMYSQQYQKIPPGSPITAELYMPDPQKVIAVFANGSYFSGRDILTLAYWAWSEKLSNMLPFDYKIPSIKQKSISSAKSVF